MDPYKDLGVPTDADPDAIKRAHRRGAKKHHPDAKGDGAEPDAEKFGAIQRAYGILSDPGKRAQWDQTGKVDSDSAHAAEEHLQRIAAGVAEIVNQILESDIDLDHEDISAVIRAHMDKIRAGIDEQMRGVAKRKKRLATIQKRFKRKGVSSQGPVLIQVMQLRAAALAQDEEKVKAAQALQVQVRAVFDAFGYEFTVKPPPATPRYEDMPHGITEEMFRRAQRW